MSGSGGGGGGGGGDYDPRPMPKPSDGGGDGDPCAIMEIAALNSPNAAVVQTLRVGDLLDVVYVAGPPQLLIARTLMGQTAGSITSPAQLRIIDCIANRGVQYSAEVVSVRGAVVQVRISRI